MKKAKSVPVFSFLLLPLAVFAGFLYQFNIQNINDKLSKIPEESVAGISTTKKSPVDITNEIPLLADSKIISIDKLSNNKNNITVTIDTNGKSKSEVEIYYKDYLYLNHWEQITQNTYTKDNKQLSIDISDAIATINILTK